MDLDKVKLGDDLEPLPQQARKRRVASPGDTGVQSLPPVPGGFTRATNFTNPNVGPKLLSGEPFRYGRGMITSTTDSFSSNEDLRELLEKGKTGSFDRNSFGSDVVLMDIPNQEYKNHANPTISTGEVDNSRVLGIFNVKTQQLRKNPNYNPFKTIEEIASKEGGRFSIQPINQSLTPIPQPSAGGSEDIDPW